MMNCRNARRFLYAFTDGELSVKDNCEVLDHLKMCADCARLVAEQESLRDAVKRHAAGPAVPAALLAKVRSAIASADEPASPRVSVPAGGRLNRLRWFVPLTAAAAVALAATVVWRTTHDATLLPGPGIRNVTQSDLSVVRVVQTHERCMTHCDTHHDARLPIELARLPAAVNVTLEEPIHALAPDFSGAGYAFESAAFCAAQQDAAGLHLLYLSADTGDRLSFFSAPRWDCLDDGSDQAGQPEKICRRFGVSQTSGEYAVVAWHDGDTTHICCGRMTVAQLEKLVEPIRVAVAERRDAFARLWQRSGLMTASR